MISDLNVTFSECESSFELAAKPNRDDWIDSSHSRFAGAIGQLRIPLPDNGRYESKHPILDDKGNQVAILRDGVTDIGYTWACVYANEAFWVAHQTFSATMSQGGTGISVIARTGKSFFAGTVVYSRVETFPFGSNWPDTIKAFKLLEDGNQLLYITDYGMALFDTLRLQQLMSYNFDKSYSISDFALSPKVKTIAAVFSEKAGADPVDGEERYRNVIRLIDLRQGRVVGEHDINHLERERWNVAFSKSGRQLKVISRDIERAFELRAE